MKIIQLLPGLQSEPGGIKDYSLKLAEELVKKHGLLTQFITCEQQIQIEPVINGFPVIKLLDRTPEAFLSSLPENIDGIILHYNFTGSWLLEALQLAQRLHRFKLVVMFHELIPHPNFHWKSKIAFRLRQLLPARELDSLTARGFARIADGVLTDSARFQAILSRWVKRPITCIPDFSTIGEPEQVPPLVERDRRLIVFGKPYSRERVYKKSCQELLSSCQILSIEEIYDIGTPLTLNLPEFNGIRVVEMGEQPPEAIGQLMLSSLAGFFDYSYCPGDLGKSTIFAAFCAHGLIPVSSQYNPSEATGLEINKHYVVPDEQLKNFNLRQLQLIADHARQWYSHHTLTENAKVFASYLLE